MHAIDAKDIEQAGSMLHLAPQASRLLCLLASHPGSIVTRDQIRQCLWSEDTFVDYDLGVNYCLNRIRSVLHDSARVPHYIETVSRRGYRFIAPVETTTAPPTVAVLPFANLNGDVAFDYFADGVTDALITELGCIASLRVISRQSVLHLKGTTAILPEIARELDADAVVEGTATHGENRVRITAQLIRTDPERHVWARSYECDLKDVLDIQRQVAHDVAEGVHAVMTPDDVIRLSRPQAVDPAVYDAYLKARHCSGTWTREGFDQALRYLHEAIAVDPSYAPAHAALADCLSFLSYFGHMSLHAGLPLAKEAAMKAVQLGDGHSFAHAVMGWICWIYDWDVAACERELDRALKIDPSNATARMARSEVLLTMHGEREQAFEETRLALQLDPLSHYANTCASWLYLFARDYDRAAAQAQRTLELHPGSLHALYVLGWTHLLRNHDREAVRAFETAAAASRDALTLGYVGYAYGQTGKTAEAKHILQELLDRNQQEFVPNKAFLCLYAGLGDNDRTFEWLEKALVECDPVLLWLGVAPPVDPVRDDRRFSDFTRRVTDSISGFPLHTLTLSLA